MAVRLMAIIEGQEPAILKDEDPMSAIPEPMLARRKELGHQFLHGQGIEIGALHHPMSVPDDANVRYVDRLSVENLREHYPELNHLDLVNVDVVDDGEMLHHFPDNSLDFIIANHMLEHTENPLGTIRRHLRKVKPGGVLYYAIPDRRMSFDVDRKLTSFLHLVLDDRLGPALSRERHFREWVKYVTKEHDPVRAKAELEKLMRINYSIHFHVWQTDSFLKFIKRAMLYLFRRFRIEHFSQNDTEAVAILRKRW
jgi:SAM-dependent methyltransferase